MISKHIWLAVCATLSLTCCFNGAPKENDNGAHFGWRTTGLNPNPDELDSIGTGIQKITHVGNRLFAMDTKTGAHNKKEFRMFTTMQGDTTWDTLWLPNKVVPYSWIADSQYLYVGTDRTGEVWQYDPTEQTWLNLYSRGDTLFRVYGFGFYQGQLVASLASGYDTTVAPVIMRGSDGKWADINANKSFPITAFHSAVEHDNALYVATYNKGVWFWSVGSGMWKRITDPPNLPGLTSKVEFPRAILIFEQSLIVSYWNGYGVRKYLGENEWQRIDSMVQQNGNGRLTTTTAFSIFTLATWNGHLFSAGYLSSNPTVYTGPKEPKGWRKISRETYCPEGAFKCLGTDVGDMAVLNDTLYAAAWDALIKYPLVQLEEGIKDAPAYPVLDSLN